MSAPSSPWRDAHSSPRKEARIRKTQTVPAVVANEPPAPTTPAPHLPTEILMRVFSYLPYTEVVRTCSAVSKDWRQAAKETALPIIPLPPEYFRSPDRLQSLLSAWPQFRALSFAGVCFVCAHGYAASDFGSCAYASPCSPVRSCDYFILQLCVRVLPGNAHNQLTETPAWMRTSTHSRVLTHARTHALVQQAQE